MKRYERRAVALLASGLALALDLAMRSDAGTIADGMLWPLWMAALALMIGCIAAAKNGWEKDTGKKAVLFFDLSKEVRK